LLAQGHKFLLLAALLALQLWAPCATTNKSVKATKGYVKMDDKSQEWLRPAGWHVESTLWVPTEPAPYFTTNSPIATILTKGKQMAILIRGA
jgi:hypothetical protein